MMFVAASLLKEHPIRRNADEAMDEFRDWLSRYLLTRADGKWLADRRDPRLTADPPAPEGYGDKLWRWTVSTEHLNQQLVTDDDLIVLWGYWTGGKGDHSETISVRSALVSLAGAESLVATLQLAVETGRFILPKDGSDDDLELGHLMLKGWIADDDASPRIDASDLWAEGLHYPGPAPSAETIAKLSLAASADGRTWTAANGGLLRSETWSHIEGYGREEETISGTRLSGNLGFLKQLLNAHPEFRLVVSVTIQRKPPRYGKDEDEFVRYPWPYVRYYLMGYDGVAQTL